MAGVGSPIYRPGGSEGDVQINHSNRFGGRTLTAGSNITITTSPTTITFTASAGAGLSGLDPGAVVFADGTGAATASKNKLWFDDASIAAGFYNLALGTNTYNFGQGLTMMSKGSPGVHFVWDTNSPTGSTALFDFYVGNSTTGLKGGMYYRHYNGLFGPGFIYTDYGGFTLTNASGVESFKYDNGNDRFHMGIPSSGHQAGQGKLNVAGGVLIGDGLMDIPRAPPTNGLRVEGESIFDSAVTAKTSVGIGTNTIQNNLVVDADGDMWLLANASYTASTGRFYRINCNKAAWGIEMQGGGLFPGEVDSGFVIWRATGAVAGDCSIGTTFGAVGGWELGYDVTSNRDLVVGGGAIEMDGFGSFPYGRLIHSTLSGSAKTGIGRNLYNAFTAHDSSLYPDLFVGFSSDTFIVAHSTPQAIPNLRNIFVASTGTPSIPLIGAVAARTYYGDGSNLTGIVGVGGGGGNPLEVFSNFGGGRSSPTVSIGIGQSLTLVVSGSTASINVNPSSVTTLGQTIEVAEISDISTNYVSFSSFNANALTLSSATVNYLTKSSATGTYLNKNIAVLPNTILVSSIPATSVTPGSYTVGSFTVDAYGRLTAASSGSAGSGSSLYAATGTIIVPQGALVSTMQFNSAGAPTITSTYSYITFYVNASTFAINQTSMTFNNQPVAFTTDNSTNSTTFVFRSTGVLCGGATYYGHILNDLYGSTITRIEAESTPLGSTVTFKIEYRNRGSNSSPGTQVIASTANSDGKLYTAFTNTIIPADARLFFQTNSGSCAGGVLSVGVTVWYTEPRR